MTEGYIQQNVATAHTTNQTIDYLTNFVVQKFMTSRSHNFTQTSLSGHLKKHHPGDALEELQAGFLTNVNR
jgi:hypothetical protein